MGVGATRYIQLHFSKKPAPARRVSTEIGSASMSAWVEQATRTVCGGPHMGSPHTVLRLTTARVQPSRRGGQGRAGGGDNAPAALRGKVRGVLFLPPKALRQLQNGVIQKIDLIMDTAAIRGRWVGVMISENSGGLCQVLSSNTGGYII